MIEPIAQECNKWLSSLVGFSYHPITIIDMPIYDPLHQALASSCLNVLKITNQLSMQSTRRLN